MTSVLEDPNASLMQIMSAIRELEANHQFKHGASLGVASNVTLSLFDQYLKRHAYIHDIQLEVVLGNYDDIRGDLNTFREKDIQHALILLFFDNLLPAFEAQIPSLAPETIELKKEDVRQRLQLAFAEAKNFRKLYVTSFHRTGPPLGCGAPDEVALVIDDFNAMLREEALQQTNVEVIDLANLIATIGRKHAFDWRFYAQAKAPYSRVALDTIAHHLRTISRGYGSYYHKALVLDCDNTLWGGIIGEDLIEGIKLDPHSYPGNVYWTVQKEIIGLQRRGVLLCLCSKNNPEDVQNVLDNHPHMVIGEPQIVLQKVNWQPKVQNIEGIAKSLNIGLDSIVFIDDSDFECNAVRARLPMVHTVQVPKRITEYVPKIRAVAELFVGDGISAESRKKTEQYRLKAKSEQERSKFDTHEAYLKSLGLTVQVGRDLRARTKRISELTMKSNQFNLTTRRYSEADIERMFDDTNFTVYSFQVGDKFGDYGLTGIIIIGYEETRARVDSFLMSCRVLGRDIELAIWNPVISDIRTRGCTHVSAQYLPTAKNAQTQLFYERIGFQLRNESADGRRQYETGLDVLELAPTYHVTISDG